MKIGDIIKDYRKEHGLSIREMSRVLGCHYSTLSRIENGITHPSMYTLRKVATLTGRDIDDLIDASINLSVRPTEDELDVLHAYRYASPEIKQAIRDVLHVQIKKGS